MTYLLLIVSSLNANKPRAIFTLGSIVVAFLLFGLLLPVERVFNSRVDLADADRLIIINKASIMRPLPVSYKSTIEEIENVDLVSHFTFFGAFYQEPNNGIAAIATDPELFDAMVGEVTFRDMKALNNWINNPTGIAVGRQLAQKMSWEVGDIITVYSTIYQRTDGSHAWTFTVDAIFDSNAEDGNTESMVINYDYFDRARMAGKGTVGWYAVRLTNSTFAQQVSSAVDEEFKNMPTQTKTTTEKMFAQSFLRQVGNFGVMVAVALSTIFWTVILITANTMAQSVRERFSDIAILQVLGLTGIRVFFLVILESIFLIAVGGYAGLALAGVIIPEVASRTDQLLSAMSMEWVEVAWGTLLIIVISLIVGVLPAARAARQSVAAGLREV